MDSSARAEQSRRTRARVALSALAAAAALGAVVVAITAAAGPDACGVDPETTTAPGCTVVREDTAAAADPEPGLWGAIECATSARHRRHGTGGDPAPKADGAAQGDTAHRSLTVLDGDDFYGQRCELGRNERRHGESAAGSASGTMGLYREGERRITFFSQRYGAGFDPSVRTWQVVFQQKQAQPYAASDPPGVAIELQIHDGELHLASFWSTRWSTRAPRLGTWIRYALDVTYSTDPDVGRMQLHVDLNGDGDFGDAGEVSPVLAGATLAQAAEAGHGLDEGEPIPGHLRLGLYADPDVPCPPPDGCRVDVDNVQIVE